LICVIEVLPVFLSTDTWYTLIKAFDSEVEGAAGRWMLSSAFSSSRLESVTLLGRLKYRTE